jgi:hypothetical protein
MLTTSSENFKSYSVLFSSVKSCVAQVTVLEWDQSGHYLLIGDTAVNAEIGTTLTHLLNEWTRVANICIPDEPIQAGMFFFNGKKVMYS